MSLKSRLTLLDKLCLHGDHILRTLTNNTKTTGEVYPAKNKQEPEMTDQEKKHVASLMRINHTGEVCAQALYHGQAIASSSPDIQEKMQHAAVEEGDHLAWCKKRLDELGSRTSFLNPVWYAGSFLLGYTAGKIGDAWSLGFVAETETQVMTHLKNHLDELPLQDEKSRLILTKMEEDEMRHRDEAIHHGAKVLPAPVKFVMGVMSKVMVKTVYYI